MSKYLFFSLFTSVALFFLLPILPEEYYFLDMWNYVIAMGILYLLFFYQGKLMKESMEKRLNRNVGILEFLMLHKSFVVVFLALVCFTIKLIIPDDLIKIKESFQLFTSGMIIMAIGIRQLEREITKKTKA
jgi:hypothetical protein